MKAHTGSTCQRHTSTSGWGSGVGEKEKQQEGWDLEVIGNTSFQYAKNLTSKERVRNEGQGSGLEKM